MSIELIGYIASGLIILSLVMSSQKRLRIINATGCSIYALYGFFIDSYPVLLMNLLCVGINFYHLKIKQSK